MNSDLIISIIIPLIIALIVVLVSHWILAYRDFLRYRNGLIDELEENYDNFCNYFECSELYSITLFSNSAFLEFRNKGYLYYLDRGVKSELNGIYLLIDSFNHTLLNYQILKEKDIQNELRNKIDFFIETLDFFDFKGDIQYLRKLRYRDLIKLDFQ
jgi:hypothetical protein